MIFVFLFNVCHYCWDLFILYFLNRIHLKLFWDNLHQKSWKKVLQTKINCHKWFHIYNISLLQLPVSYYVHSYVSLITIFQETTINFFHCFRDVFWQLSRWTESRNFWHEIYLIALAKRHKGNFMILQQSSLHLFVDFLGCIVKKQFERVKIFIELFNNSSNFKKVFDVFFHSKNTIFKVYFQF